jgi:hypothetical protein
MQVSKVFANVDAKPVNVNSLQDLAKLATSSAYSLGVFAKNHRTTENFQQTEAIGLDFDDGMTLEQAKLIFSGYKHLILPTKSHQKEKNGVVADRFRVILFLSYPITDAETYAATWQKLKDAFPSCDPACKDPARQFYKSTGVASINDKGLLVDPVKPQAKPKLEVVTPLPEGHYGELSKFVYKFLAEGAMAGGRNQTVHKVAREFHQAGYPQSEAERRIVDALKKNNVIAPDFTETEARNAIKSAYSKDPKHPPRVEEKAFSFMPIGELMNRKIEVDWIVGGLLTKGGTSIFAGEPKSGKSTLVRQLVASICHGTDFLGHKCKQGGIVYLAMEEQDAMLKNDFKRLGVNEKDPITIHVGGALTLDAVKELEQYLIETRPMLTIVDTLMDLAQIKNSSDYAEVKAVMARLRKIARDSGSHLLFVHHARKPQDGASGGGVAILGSTAFFGGVDMVLTIAVVGRERKITTRGRGVKMYDMRPIIFDAEKHTFTLGPMEDEF